MSMSKSCMSGKSGLYSQNLLHSDKLHSDKRKCVRLLRPCCDAKHFSTTKTIFIYRNVPGDFCVCTVRLNQWVCTLYNIVLR